MENMPGVGIAAMIYNNNGELLLGLRKGKHAHGTWGFPGGHLEFMETPEQGIVREVLEETGMRVISMSKVDYTNDFYPEERKHVVTLFYKVITEGAPLLLEPEKCAEWKWFRADQLPSPLMPPITHLLDQGYTL